MRIHTLATPLTLAQPSARSFFVFEVALRSPPCLPTAVRPLQNISICAACAPTHLDWRDAAIERRPFSARSSSSALSTSSSSSPSLACRGDHI